MNEMRFNEITAKYSRLRIAVVGDFCLDRYLEIDPARRETSIETGLEVHNVVNVRSQPGAAGTILNNLVALGVGEVYPVGFCGDDGEGYELLRALEQRRGVRIDHFLRTPARRTFTYCKPLVLETGRAPRELNRLDSKNWSPTPEPVQQTIVNSVVQLSSATDAFIFMDQVSIAETGVITRRVLDCVRDLTRENPAWLAIADSRRGLKDFPAVCLKMNAAELRALTGHVPATPDEVKSTAAALAISHRRPVFITLAERGIVGADASGHVEDVSAFPTRGEIDIVGAGDAVMANLTAALAAGATIREALELAMAAASIVIHQLGTTGTARVGDIRALLLAS
ncbi:MAG TPA: PfkB family carbohydrate kinase [Methylomirabilota bacterium]|nr:PfkB family carbohydrate kinase [Methylomirabilota bacterium]